MPTPDTATVFRTVPLGQLTLAPENVRATPPGKAAQAQLKVSIVNHGLLENLVARMDDAGPDGTERFAVVAGGRRLAILQELAAKGDIPADYSVPCNIVANDNAAEISLAENIVRLPMHPADQFVAFKTLIDNGATLSEVASRFSASQRLVKRRIRLGNAAQAILDAFRQDRIDLDTVMAYCLTTDHERQMAVFDQVSKLPYRLPAHQVKTMLTDDAVPSSSAIARFVTVNAYQRAGGTLLRDLFSGSNQTRTWLDNPGLLNELAMAKLAKKAETIAKSWAWAEPALEADWQTTAPYGHVHQQRAEPTDEERASMEKHQGRLAELHEIDDENWTEEHDAEMASVHRELAQLNQQIRDRDSWRAEDMAAAGCIVTIARDGAMRVLEGLVRPEDVPEPQTDDTAETANGQRYTPPADDSPRQRLDDPATLARKQAGIGIALSDDLRFIRTAMVKAHLSRDFEAAFDLMLFQIVRSIHRESTYHTSALDIVFKATSDRPPGSYRDEAFNAWSPGETMIQDISDLAADWLRIEDDGEAFAAMCVLPQADKEALFAAAVARTLNGQLAFEPTARPEFEATVARLDIDFAGHVRPTADMFWSRINKSMIAGIATETLGKEWVHSRSKYKKGDLAKAMEDAFAAGETPVGVSAEAHAAALAWTPPGFVAPVEPGTDVPETDDTGDRATAANGSAAAPAADDDDDGTEAAPTTGQAPEPDVPEFLRQAS